MKTREKGCLEKSFIMLGKKYSILHDMRREWKMDENLYFTIITFFWQSCKHDGWTNIGKYLTDDVPLLLRSHSIKDVKDVISTVFSSLPSDFTEFIKWVAEVRLAKDGGVPLNEQEKVKLELKVRKQILLKTETRKHLVGAFTFHD